MAGRPAPEGAILALNAGSSSLKFGLYAVAPGEPARLAEGQIENLDRAPHLVLHGADGSLIAEQRWPDAPGPEALLAELLARIENPLGGAPLAAIGHRIVHGGARFAAPVRLDPEVLAALEALTPLAPLHQPLGLAPVAALGRLRPGLLQVACFDTAFHRDLAPPVSRYAIPRRYEREGVRRYGFHGLSYAYIARRLGELSPDLPPRRTVVAHLGNGASLCAMRNGVSCDTTMGFSALDGLVMGSRCGSIDPGVLLYLLQHEGLSPAALEDLLYHRSGLLGVSEISGDMRDLLASPDPRAREAVELFAFRIARETAALANTLGGLETLVFTGGIGEHAAPVRALVASQLGWLGVAIDALANDRHAVGIAAAGARVAVLVIPTDEELTIARAVLSVLAAG